MSAKRKILEDVARAAGGGAGVISGFARQVKDDVRMRVEEVALRLDLIPREEFERLEAVVNAQAEQIGLLAARLEKLEGGKKAPAKKPAAKKVPAKKLASKKTTAKKTAKAKS